MELVSEKDVIDTYSKEDQFYCQKYSEYLELMQSNPTIGYKNAARLLDILPGCTRWWHSKCARSKPIPWKTVEKLQSCQLLPFTIHHQSAEDTFRILGTIFGDGCVDKNLNTLSFISSIQENIDRWKADLVNIFPFAEKKLSVIETGEYGHAFCIRTTDRAVIRFFVALGAPVGNKVTKPYTLPKSFQFAPKKLKIAFFDGLFSSEIATPRFVLSAHHTNYFKNFSLSLSKLESLEESHKEFLNAVKLELASLGVKTTLAISKASYWNSYHRKDGRISHGYRIFFQCGESHVASFNRMFPLKYATEKKQKLQQEVKKAVAETLKQSPLLYH